MEVLLVDDSKTMRMLVQRAIRQAGFTGLTFIEAENGMDALQKLSTHTPQLILSDWNMPEMTGIDFLRQVRACANATPFGFITSEGSKEIYETAMTAGAQFLITKPFTPEDVQERLRPVLGARA
ncbi:MAG: response regulator [Acidobacteriaceae bacterium]|nr:response regulator [Acidobacteriaceae bacterium]